MLNIPGRIDSVTGMLSVLDLLRNREASWGCKTALNAHQSDGTISLDLLRYGDRLRQRKVRFGIACQYLGDRRLGWKLRSRWHRRSFDLHFLVTVHACTGRDEVTDDDVLLESEQLVPRATYSGVGQNTRRLLEARCRDERLSREAGLGDAEQQGFRNRRILLLLLRLVVRFSESLLVALSRKRPFSSLGFIPFAWLNGSA